MTASTNAPLTRPPPPTSRGDYSEFTPLFHEFAAATTDAERCELRSQLVTGHLPLAEHIARRFRNRGQPIEDLTQVAIVGLINAVDRFDPDRGSNFLAFAVPTITGELRRYFRDATWDMRVPRRFKELYAAVNAATTTLGQELGRSPRPSELAATLGLPIEEVYDGLRASHAYHCDSLDSGTSDDVTTSAEAHLGITDDGLSAVEDREALYPALAKLPEREAAIVVLRFFGNLTQSQIADRIGISQMHVSRLLASSLATMRAALTAD